jgi:hypothetical protein
MRKAAYRIVDGSREALVTVIDFPANAGPMITDPVSQVRRWRGEVGLPPLDDARIKNSLQPIEIDGMRAEYAEVLPDAAQSQESQADRGTLAAILKRGDMMWFFKLNGPRELVAAERENFKSFVTSVRFVDVGAADGN